MSGSKKFGGSGELLLHVALGRHVVVAPHGVEPELAHTGARWAGCRTGFAKGTGYIMPSMHVGMWTPNLMRRAPEISGTGHERRQQLGRDAAGAARPGRPRRRARRWACRDPPRSRPRAAAARDREAGEREGVDLVLGDEGRSRLAARSRRADRERLGLRDAGLGQDRLAVEMREVAGEERPHGSARARRRHGRSRRARRRARGRGRARIAGAPARSSRAPGARGRGRT